LIFCGWWQNSKEDRLKPVLLETLKFVIKLSLIGMSGTGKSHWSQKFASVGFHVIGVDDRIEEKLAPELEKDGHKGIGGVAAWMGWPDSPTYREREKKYLEYEIESMKEALDEIEASDQRGTVLDTTGSVIYTGHEICRRMQKLTKVVYLEASPEEENILIELYLSNPKPVVWGDQFVSRAGESTLDAIARCYPKLIAYRKQMYKHLAERIVPMSILWDTNRDARGFLEYLEIQARPAQ
jgi:shikimate kinase